ncbi:MAG: replicative DNA helicase, partial [Bacillati bacterium ANGP1]
MANAVGDGSLNAIPSAVFTLPREQIVLFLNRLCATGGWVCVTPESGVAQIGCAAVSERLVRQIQHLLLRFGIIAGLRQTSRGAWEIEITEPASTLAFAQHIGISDLKRRERELLSVVAGGGRNPSTGAIRLGGRQESLGRLASSDVHWDEIISIEPVGPKQVYDLTIPDTHNFVANDICVHNTTLCTNIAQHAALTNKLPVAIFSLETSKEQLVQRILCSEARVDNTKLRTGFLADEDWRKLARAMGNLSEAPIFIDDSATLSVMEMRAKARKLKAEHGLGMIVIDYMQMIQSYKRAENRTQELSEIARGIKSLAKELDIPIIAISQLSRAVEALG